MYPSGVHQMIFSKECTFLECSSQGCGYQYYSLLDCNTMYFRLSSAFAIGYLAVYFRLGFTPKIRSPLVSAADF
jgi:hypothetical protein